MPSRRSSMLLFHIIRAQVACVCDFAKCWLRETREAAVKAPRRPALEKASARMHCKNLCVSA